MLSLLFVLSLLKLIVDQELVYFCFISIWNVFQNNICSFGILMFKTTRTTKTFCFGQTKLKSSIRWVILFMFIRKCPEHLWMPQAGFWLLAMKLIAAEGPKRGLLLGAVGVIGLSRCLIMKCLSSCLPLCLQMSFPEYRDMDLRRRKHFWFGSFIVLNLFCNIKKLPILLQL